MTLEQLRIFVCVAERLNMTRAAEVLHITQSGVSASISALENAYGTALFDRVGRRIELSIAGQAFLVEAEKVLEQVQKAQRTLSDLSNLRRGTISVCASQTIGNYWLPRFIAEFNARFPHLGVELRIANTAGVTRLVLEGRAELGFVEGSHPEAMLDETLLEGDRLGVFVRPDHPWASQAPTAEALTHGGWVLREAGSGTRSEFVQGMAALGVDVRELDVRMEMPTNESVRAAVVAGVGPGAFSELVAHEALAAGALVRAPVELPRRFFRVMRHTERKLSRAAEMFMKGLPSPQQASPELRLVAGVRQG